MLQQSTSSCSAFLHDLLQDDGNDEGPAGAAAQLIQRSCDALYRNNAMLLPRERRYNECVVQSLPGVRDNYAIQQIMAICSRRGEM